MLCLLKQYLKKTNVFILTKKHSFVGKLRLPTKNINSNKKINGKIIRSHPPPEAPLNSECFIWTKEQDN